MGEEGLSPTDAELVAASLREPQRFALLFDRHAQALHRYVASYVSVTTNPSLSYDDAITPVANAAHPYFSSFKSFEGVQSDPTDPGSPGLFQWSGADPGPVVDQFMETLRASGLFASVSEI